MDHKEERESFVRSILQNSEDDLPYLIYADRLDEWGDFQGQLIRYWVEMNTPGCAYTCNVLERTAMRGGHVFCNDWRTSGNHSRPKGWVDWVRNTFPKPANTHRFDLEFRKGMLDAVQCTWEWFHTNHDSFASTQPLKRVRLVTNPWVEERYSDGRWVARFRTEDVYGALGRGIPQAVVGEFAFPVNEAWTQFIRFMDLRFPGVAFDRAPTLQSSGFYRTAETVEELVRRLVRESPVDFGIRHPMAGLERIGGSNTVTLRNLRDEPAPYLVGHCSCEWRREEYSRKHQVLPSHQNPVSRFALRRFTLRDDDREFAFWVGQCPNCHRAYWTRPEPVRHGPAY